MCSANESLLNEHILETTFTNKFIIEKIAEKNPKFATLLKTHYIIEIKSIDITESNGFTSNIIRFVVQFDKLEAPFSVIVKIFNDVRITKMVNEMWKKRPLEDELKNMTNVMRRMHNKECQVYEFLRISQSSIPYPEIYFTQRIITEKNDGGIIIMEDMSTEAFTVSFHDGLNEQQIINVVEHLAHFHKYILYDADKEWFKNFEERVFESDTDKFLDDIFVFLLERDKEHYAEMVENLKKLLGINFTNIANQECIQKLGIPAVLVHGDLWANNLIWKKRADDEEAEIKAFIDWQLSFKGNPTSDIARLIITSTTPEVRRKIEEKSLQHYYKTLKRIIEKSGQKIDYNFEELEKAYHYSQIEQAINGFFFAMIQEKSIKNSEEQCKINALYNRAEEACKDSIENMKKTAPEYFQKL